MHEDIRLPATSPGATALAVRAFRPEGEPRAVLVIGGAMGVRQSFYAPFAQWLAGQGFLAFTFDYRGCGDSLPPGQPLRTVRADLFDWAEDYAAVIDHFGFFREQFRASLWPRAIASLDALASLAAAPVTQPTP